MYNFEALDEKDRQNMLISIGVESIDKIFDIIPDKAKMKELNLASGCDEIEAQKNLKKLSRLNKTNYLNFLGLGAKKGLYHP